MMLSGNLTDWSVGDLLQMLHITKKTASLHVTGTDRYGVVHFEDGAIVNADVSLGGGAASDPKDEVVEAIYVLELLDEGAFEIKGEVPSRTIDPISVADALELAGQHLDAERHLDETGLLAARGLRLAQTISEPIILSEQVWNAISGSIPAFTFPELEERMGRAAAVATVEQFRDLGILEAVLEEPERAERFAQTPIEHVEIVEPVESADPGWADDSFDREPAPVAVAQATEVDETPDLGWGSQVVDGPPVADGPDPVDTADHAAAPSDTADESMIVPVNVEEIRPIVSDAPERDIVVEPIDDAAPAPSGPPPASGVTSLSAAIRAAAGAAEHESSDDEGSLLSEAAGDGGSSEPDLAQGEDESLRRTVRSLVSEPKSPLTNGMLGDLGARIRQAAAAESDD